MFSYSWSNLPGPFVFVQVTAYTSVAPTITLVSSSAAPEASTWTMLTLGFAALGGATWRMRAARQTREFRRREEDGANPADNPCAATAT